MMLMKQTMRWFGPDDPVSLADIRQAGCAGVVTALHHVPVGEVWTLNEIENRKTIIKAAGMEWSVVESLPVHEEIKKRDADHELYIANYIKSLENLAAAGIKVVTYNFMPVLDWMRTDIAYTLPQGSKALRFEKAAFVAFDVYLLGRPGADRDYTKDDLEKAKAKLNSMSAAEKEILYSTALMGLPGSEEKFTKEKMLELLKSY